MSPKQFKTSLANNPLERLTPPSQVGMWRSLVARFAGGEEVAGSNPVIPTIAFFLLKLLTPNPLTSFLFNKKDLQRCLTYQMICSFFKYWRILAFLTFSFLLGVAVIIQ